MSRFLRPCAFVLAGVLASAPASATDVLVPSNALAPAQALMLATGARDACRARDMQVSVAVVDRAGALQVFLRDRLAGNFTHPIAVAKATTAAGFRRDTLSLQREMPSRPELEAIDRRDDVLFVGGGIPVEVAGSVVGAIGVSGAPTPQADHDCAAAAIDALSEELLF